MSIATIWWDAQEGHWDSGLLKSIFDANPQHFIQYNQKELVDTKRAIVLVVGKPEIKPLRDYLATLESGIAILMSEEDGFLRWKEAIPEHIETWTQYFTPTTKSEIKSRILLGAPNRIKNYSINSHLSKKYLWSFIGQAQNTYRQEMIEVVKNMPDGYLQVCDSFGGYGHGGAEYQTYLDVLCQSKFVLCPSGSMNTDSFRVYESILAGAIPIVNKNCPRDAKDFNYWNEVYLYNTLLKVENWKQLSVEWLEAIYGQSFDNDNSLVPDIDTVNNWWGGYVRQLTDKLISIAKGLV